MAARVYLVVGDTSPDLVATLYNADGPQDLTGASVVMRLKPSNGGAVQTVAMDIDEPETAGVVRHAWDAEETASAVRYAVEFVVTYADTGQQTFPLKPADVPTITIRAAATA